MTDTKIYELNRLQAASAKQDQKDNSDFSRIVFYAYAFGEDITKTREQEIESILQADKAQDGAPTNSSITELAVRVKAALNASGWVTRSQLDLPFSLVAQFLESANPKNFVAAWAAADQLTMPPPSFMNLFMIQAEDSKDLQDELNKANYFFHLAEANRDDVLEFKERMNYELQHLLSRMEKRSNAARALYFHQVSLAVENDASATVSSLVGPNVPDLDLADLRMMDTPLRLTTRHPTPTPSDTPTSLPKASSSSSN